MSLQDKLKALMVKEQSKDSKRKIENAVVFILIIIITIIAINTIWNGNKAKESKDKPISDGTKQLATTQNKENPQTEQTDMEKRLESMLSNISGVGNVKVLITYSETSQVVAMYNENNKNSQIEEKDSGRRNKNDDPK